MFITDDENMRDFNMDLVEVIEQTDNTMIIRTADLLPTLQFMQECWWRLYELLPDDEWEMEFNILTYYKPKWQRQN